jgi:hypothetical protein
MGHAKDIELLLDDEETVKVDETATLDVIEFGLVIKVELDDAEEVDVPSAQTTPGK